MSSLLTTNEGKKMDDEQSSSTNECVEKLKKYIYQVSELAFKDGGEVPILQGISTHYRRAVQGIINGSKGKYLPPEVISTIIFDLVNMLQSISYKDKAAYSTILAFGIYTNVLWFKYHSKGIFANPFFGWHSKMIDFQG